MTTQELYDYITSYMTPEEALLKLLGSSTLQYEKLKFEEGKEVHPIIIIANAAFDLGWVLAIEKEEQGDVRGLSLGTHEYLDSLFKNSSPVVI
jgi:hypothetical protein